MHKVGWLVLEIKFWWAKITSFFANSKINKEIRRNQRWVADDVSDDVLQRLVNLNSGLRPKLSCLGPVFGLSERLIQIVKWPIDHLAHTEWPVDYTQKTPPSPLLAVPNVTAHRSTLRVPTSYYLAPHFTLVKEALIEIGCVVTSLVVGWSLVVSWLVGCHARALWPNGAF